jgi:hypothetical protein
MRYLLKLIQCVKRVPIRDQVVLQSNHIEVIEPRPKLDFPDLVLTDSQSFEYRQISESLQLVPRLYPILFKVQKLQVLEIVLRNLILR